MIHLTIPQKRMLLRATRENEYAVSGHPQTMRALVDKALARFCMDVFMGTVIILTDLGIAERSIVELEEDKVNRDPVF